MEAAEARAATTQLEAIRAEILKASRECAVLEDRAAGLRLAIGAAEAATQPAMQSAKPRWDAISYVGGKAIDVRRPMVASVEFLPGRMNLTLYNGSKEYLRPDVRVVVLNKDGIELWEHNEQWAVTSMAPEEKNIVSVAFEPRMPAALEFSPLAQAFDKAPQWIIIESRRQGHILEPVREDGR